ncbi:unnamed protein product [Rhizophagus irregularis]|nr:unnamed protein product [Rhizophagus irregularis]
MFYPETEKELYDWIIEQRKQGLGVTYAITRVKMLDILKKPAIIGLYGDSTNEFKTSFRWIFAFMKRYNLSQRRQTNISQKLLLQTSEVLKNFQEFIIHLRTEKLFELSNILNIDETSVWFNMAGNFTIDNNRDGTKFSPICIFKGKRLPHNEQFPSGVIVWFQQNRWMDAQLMKKYVDYIKEHLEINNIPTIMVYDSFRRHLEESVKTKFRDKGIDLAVIPGGGAGIITSGNLCCARLSDVCEWVKRAWEGIPDEMVIESFKTCRISTFLNGLDNEITDNEDSDVGGDIDGDGNYE